MKRSCRQLGTKGNEKLSFPRKRESRRRPCENREPEYEGTGCPIKNFGHDKYKTLDSPVSSTGQAVSSTE